MTTGTVKILMGEENSHAIERMRKTIELSVVNECMAAIDSAMTSIRWAKSRLQITPSVTVIVPNAQMLSALVHSNGTDVKLSVDGNYEATIKHNGGVIHLILE